MVKNVPVVPTSSPDSRRPSRVVLAIGEVFVSRALAGLLFALALVLLARWSGVGEFGRVASLVGTSYFVMAVADFGLTQYMLRRTALADAESLAAVRRALNLSKYTSLAVFVICAALGLSMSLAPLTALLIALGTALDKYADNWQSVLIAERRTRTSGLLVVSRRAVLLSCQGIGYFADVSAPVAFGIGLTAGGLLALSVRGKFLSHMREGPQFPTVAVIRDSRYYWLAVSSSQVRELEGGLLFIVAGAYSAGLYNAASRIVRPALLLAVAAATVLLPELSRRDPSEARRVAKVIGVLSIASMMCGLVLAVFAAPITEAVVGEQYEAASSTLGVLCVAIGPTAAAGLLGGVLQSQGIDRPVGLTNLGFAVASMILLVAGVAAAGPVGAAVGVSISAVAKSGLLWGFCITRLGTRRGGKSIR